MGLQVQFVQVVDNFDGALLCVILQGKEKLVREAVWHQHLGSETLDFEVVDGSNMFQLVATSDEIIW